MPAQHKRKGRKGKEERKIRAKARERKVMVIIRKPVRKDYMDNISAGRPVVIGEVV